MRSASLSTSSTVVIPAMGVDRVAPGSGAGRNPRIGRTREHRAAASYLVGVVQSSGKASGRGGWPLQASYVRRQQFRRMWRCVCSVGLSIAIALVGLAAASAGARSVGALLALAAAVVGLRTRHWFSLAGRSGIGAESEELVRRQVSGLQREGWRVRHSLRWPGGGDIDYVAVSPTGVVVAIETKTRAYDGQHLDRVRAQAAWLAARERGWRVVGQAIRIELVEPRPAARIADRSTWQRSRGGAGLSFDVGVDRAIGASRRIVSRVAFGSSADICENLAGDSLQVAEIAQVRVPQQLAVLRR
jgi:hypothetical protein